MTDSKEPKDPRDHEDDMDPRFENLAGYVLDALDTEDERAEVEALIESDRAVQTEFDELAEAAELLAIAVPQVAPPARLKARILEQAAGEPLPEVARLKPIVAIQKSHETQKSQDTKWWYAAFRSRYAVSAAAAVLVLVVAGVLGFQNNRMGNEIDTLRAELDIETTAVAIVRTELSTTMTDSETTVTSMKSEMDQMEDEFDATAALVVHQEEMVSELVVANDALRQALRDQSWLTYVALKEDYQVESWFANNQTTGYASGDAVGLIAVRVVGNEAVFQVNGLEQPQPGYAYTLWLLGNGKPMAVAQFEVSEIGSATVNFLLPAPLYFYSSAAVTQERVDAVGPDPLGVTVLSAETQ